MVHFRGNFFHDILPNQHNESKKCPVILHHYQKSTFYFLNFIRVQVASALPFAFSWASTGQQCTATCPFCNGVPSCVNNVAKLSAETICSEMNSKKPVSMMISCSFHDDNDSSSKDWT